MWKWLVGGLVGCAILCAVSGYFVVSSGMGERMVARFKPPEARTTVRVEPAEVGELVKTVSAPGSVRPETNVPIRAQVSARIVDLPFDERDQVREGDVIVRLDDEDLAAQLESARADRDAQKAQLEGTQANVNRARAALERMELLHQSGDRSDADLEAARAEYLSSQASLQATQASIESADARVRRAQRDLANTVITSPIDGTIVRLDSEEGELVLGTFNNQGQVIMQIADLSRMILYAQVDESTVAPIRAGQHAKVYLISHPDLDFSGTVQGVKLERQTTSDGTGIYETEILLDTPEENVFRVGMTANTDVEVETLTDVVRVPSQAVLDRRVEELPDEVRDSEHVDSEKAFARVVYRVVDGKTIATPVTVGPSDLTHTAILGGLDPEASVVTGPYKVLVSLGHDESVQLESDDDDEDGDDAEDNQDAVAQGS